MRRRQEIGSWLERWGFAGLVGTAAMASLRTQERALNGLLEVLDEIWDLRDDPEEG